MSDRLSRLTRRELEVAREVAKGKSNAAAADDLYIERRTIANHLWSIYTKLELGGDAGCKRVVLTRLVLEHDRGLGLGDAGEDPQR